MRHIVVLLFGFVALIAVGTTVAQPYPSRPVRLVVAFPTGGNNDVVGRMMAAQVGLQMGQTLVVDNRAGANGLIGIAIVANAVADGYTILHQGTAFAINPSIYRKLPYDMEKDLVPITIFAQGLGYLLLVNASSPVHSVKELIAMGKNKEKPISYGSAGVGNAIHLLAALFNARAGIDSIHVPYKGIGPSMNALLGGEVHFMFSAIPAALSYVRAGRLRVLAFTGSARSSVFPDVPTLSEAGIENYQLGGGWYGWLAPARTPRVIVARLHREIVKAVQVPKIVNFLKAGGYVPDRMPTEECQKFLHAEVERYAEAVRAAKIPIE